VERTGGNLTGPDLRPQGERLACAAPVLVCLALVCLALIGPARAEEAAPPIDLTPAEKAWLQDHPVIRIGAETNYAPYEFTDSRGHFTGVVADYLDILKRRLDLRFEVHPLLDFASVQDKLMKRELDLVMAVTRASDREDFLLFTKPYIHYVNVIVTRDDFGFVSGLRDFADTRVAVVEGHSSQQLIARAYPNYNVNAYPDLLDGLIAVSTGNADGLVDDIFPIVFTMRQRGISNLKIATAVEKGLQPQGFSIGVRSDWPLLVSILDKALTTITHEEQREISQKWLSVRYESKVDYRAIWTAIAVFSTILLIAVLWITQLSRQRRALVAARAEAEAANRAKDQFLASMSHELRTPLHAILGYAELMRQGNLAETNRAQALNTIAGSGRHLLTLINDLLDLSRIRSGRLDLNLEPLQLPALIEEIAAMVRVDAEKKGLSFVLDAGPGLPAVVSADGRRLRQILLNLLGNAIKFTESGRVTLAVRATPVDPQRVALTATVQDTGVGIAPEDRERVFEPFEQAEPGQKRESGVGLGLAISRELAHIMGGTIVAEGGPGGGTLFRFTVTVPVLDLALAPVPRDRQILGYSGQRRTILVVDDHEENRELLRQMLEPVGFHVTLAAGGEEAVAAARMDGADLIVMDLRMPGVNGFDAAARVGALPGLDGLPIIAASASSADLERAQADPSFALCLRKPFQAGELLEAIEHLLGLSWHYGEAGAPQAESEVAQAALRAPPAAVLEELLDLARRGKLLRVEQRAVELQRDDPACAHFAQRVHGLARRFEEEQLIALLRRCLEAQPDAVGQR
jgi:signal transduction histidine kinase/DNA-binding response OmpR family regulator